MRLGSWPVVGEVGAAPSGAPLFMSADRMGRGDCGARLCQAWRAWESGASSTLLGRMLSAPHRPGQLSSPPLWEDWIHFASDSWELDDLALCMLNPRIESLLDHQTRRIVISGRDTLSGPTARGMGLGLRRVLAIWNVLLARGIDPARIRITVRGARWSMIDRPTTDHGSGAFAGECRFQVTDPRWGLARN
jgi:hypothetical protein